MEHLRAFNFCQFGSCICYIVDSYSHQNEDSKMCARFSSVATKEYYATMFLDKRTKEEKKCILLKKLPLNSDPRNVK